MKTVQSWETYVAAREAAEKKASEGSDTSTQSEHCSYEPPPNTGKQLDEPYRDKAFEDKVQQFIKGRKNVNPAPPKGVAKGWFVVDEETKSFWLDDGWSQDPRAMQNAVVETVEAANILAKAVHGVVIPAHELLD